MSDVSVQYLIIYISHCISGGGREFPCLLYPCTNGGQCVPNGSDYICECPLPYSGKNCEQDLGMLYFFLIFVQGFSWPYVLWEGRGNGKTNLYMTKKDGITNHAFGIVVSKCVGHGL